MEYRKELCPVFYYTDQKKFLPDFLKFKLNKRGVSFLGECNAIYQFLVHPVWTGGTYVSNGRRKGFGEVSCEAYVGLVSIDEPIFFAVSTLIGFNRENFTQMSVSRFCQK